MRSKNPTAIEILQLTNPCCDDQEVGSVTTATRETSRFSQGAMACACDHRRSESKNLEDVGIVRRRLQSWSRRLAREKIHALNVDSGIREIPDSRPVNLSTLHQTHVSRRHTSFFSRGARLESSSQDSQCLSQSSQSSNQAQHVARAFLVVSFTIWHYLIFHLHSIQSVLLLEHLPDLY